MGWRFLREIATSIPLYDIHQTRLDDFNISACHVSKRGQLEVAAICAYNETTLMLASATPRDRLMARLHMRSRTLLAHTLKMYIQTALVIDERGIPLFVCLDPITDGLAQGGVIVVGAIELIRQSAEQTVSISECRCGVQPKSTELLVELLSVFARIGKRLFAGKHPRKEGREKRCDQHTGLRASTARGRIGMMWINKRRCSPCPCSSLLVKFVLQGDGWG